MDQIRVAMRADLPAGFSGPELVERSAEFFRKPLGEDPSLKQADIRIELISSQFDLFPAKTDVSDGHRADERLDRSGMVADKDASEFFRRARVEVADQEEVDVRNALSHSLSPEKLFQSTLEDAFKIANEACSMVAGPVAFEDPVGLQIALTGSAGPSVPIADLRLIDVSKTDAVHISSKEEFVIGRDPVAGVEVPEAFVDASMDETSGMVDAGLVGKEFLIPVIDPSLLFFREPDLHGSVNDPRSLPPIGSDGSFDRSREVTVVRVQDPDQVA